MARQYEGVRNVRMTDELVEKWIVRTADGRRVVWVWGEPDADGSYTPTCWAMDDGKVLVDRDTLAAALHRFLVSDHNADLDGPLPEWKADLDGRQEWYASPNGLADAILASLREPVA